MSALTAAGLRTVVGIQLRTGWKGLAAWVLGVVAMMVVTGTSITALYDTPDKLAGYAASLGGSMRMMNGDVAGMTTLGGVLANEFAVVLSFGLPLMAIALVARVRKDEEAGRLELLLASRIGRDAPLVSAVLVASVAVLVVGAACGVAMVAIGADAAGSWRYAAVIAGVGWVFVGITAVLAQVVEHHRTVWSAALATLLVVYLVRGVGASTGSVLVWLSPLGWGDEVRAFGDEPRSWPLALLLVAGGLLVALAIALEHRRDVGGALLESRPASPHASALLRSPWGLALYEHRNAVLGWSAGAAVLMGTYGSLSQEVIDAIEDNPALGDMLGADGSAAADVLLPAVFSTFLLMLALMVAAYAVMSVGALRAGEEAGRLEVALSAPRGRTAWLGAHLAVIVAGAALIGAVGATAMAGSAAAATGEQAWVGEILAGAVGYAAPVAAFLGLVVAIFGLLPGRQAWAWGVFAACALLAYLGPGLDLPGWLVDASLFAAVGGDVVGEGADAGATMVLLALAVVALVAGMVGFTRRDVPTV